MKVKGIGTFVIVLISWQLVLPPASVCAAVSPLAAEFLCERGISFFHQSQTEKALIEFRKALMANPNSAEARRYIELIKSRTAQGAAGKTVLQREQEVRVYEAAGDPGAVSTRARPVRRRRKKVIWRLEKKMQEMVDAVLAEKRLGEQPIAAADRMDLAVPQGVAASLGVPVVPSREIVVDIRDLDREVSFHEIDVAVGDTVVIRAENLKRFLTVDPGYLDVMRQGPDVVHASPREMGTTIFYVWSQEGRTGFRFNINPPRWQEVWARQIEERQQASDLPESFRLTYALEGNSTYSGRRFGSATRDAHTYFYNATASGDTPFGRIDAAVQGTRTNDKAYYIPNVRMSLTDGHYGTLKDIDIRWFDFGSSFSAFGFPGTTLRGVRVDAPMFNRALNYTAFWGALPAGDYSHLSASSGLSKTKKAWLEGIGLSYDLGQLMNVKTFFAHSYGSERTQPVLTGDAFGLGFHSLGGGRWSWDAEMSSDTEHVSYTARTSWNLPKLNIALSMADLNKGQSSIFGGTPAGGSIGGSLNLVYRPVPELTISEAFSGNRDRYFFNPDSPSRPNYNSNTRAIWTVDPHTDIELGYVYDDRKGSNVPSVTETKELIFRKRLFFIRRLSSFLSYQNNRTKNYDSPAQDFNNNRILMGVSFRVLHDLYFYYRKEFNLLHNKFTGERAQPHAQEMGLNYFRQIGDSPFYGRARLYFRDEEDTESTLSYLSGEDRLEGEGELTYRPHPDRETFVRLRVANIWAEKAGAAKNMDVDLSWGVRMAWDTGARWLTRGAFNGHVYKDINGDGRRQEDEGGVEGVRVRAGDQDCMTNAFGYFYLPDIVGPRVRVVIDPGTLPSGYSSTSSPKKEVEVIHMATRRVDFGIATRTEISGLVFVDKNGSGTYDSGDEPLEGVTLILDGKFKTASGRLGEYRFRNLSPGDHSVAINLKSVPVAYLPQVPVRKVVTVLEGAELAYHIPLSRQEKK